jgi:hypothetical protein
MAVTSRTGAGSVNDILVMILFSKLNDWMPGSKHEQSRGEIHLPERSNKYPTRPEHLFLRLRSCSALQQLSLTPQYPAIRLAATHPKFSGRPPAL